MLNAVNSFFVKMARSRWKLEYFSKSVWRKITIIKKNKKFKRRVFFDRASSVPDCFFAFYIRIHKGRRFRKILIDNFIIGKKFGEFSYTRKPFYYPAKRSKKKKKNLMLRR